MIWTKEKPTKPGWYWVRWSDRWGSANVTLTNVYSTEMHGMCCKLDPYTTSVESVTSLNGCEWAGPIPEPEECS